jgi:hypothetical protein
MEFSEGSIGGGIESAAGTDDETLLFRQPEILSRDAVGVKIAGTENACTLGEFSHSGQRLNR